MRIKTTVMVPIEVDFFVPEGYEKPELGTVIYPTDEQVRDCVSIISKSVFINSTMYNTDNEVLATMGNYVIIQNPK